MTALEMRLHLVRLTAERLDAAEAGSARTGLHGRVTEDIAESREAYVGLAVTEIATLRAELSGPQIG